MARKTKAEMMAERQEALAAREAHEFAQYPSRVMAVLERAVKGPNYFDLTVTDGQFEVVQGRETWRLGHVHSRANQQVLEDLEFSLELVEEEYKRSMELAAKKTAALNKLTREERDLLGL